jgi:hypothetical protein
MKPKRKGKKRMLARDSATGRTIPRAEAARRPAGTTVETVRIGSSVSAARILALEAENAGLRAVAAHAPVQDFAVESVRRWKAYPGLVTVVHDLVNAATEADFEGPRTRGVALLRELGEPA